MTIIIIALNLKNLESIYVFPVWTIHLCYSYICHEGNIGSFFVTTGEVGREGEGGREVRKEGGR